MLPTEYNSRGRQRGIAYVLAMLLLAIFSTLAVAFAASTDLNVQKSNNYRSAQVARMAADSGLGFYTGLLRQCQSSHAGSDLIADIAATLSEQMDGTANLAGETVGYSPGSTTITIPTISIGPEQGRFAAIIALDPADDNVVWLIVNGHGGGMDRTERMAFQLSAGGASTFDYGVATRGQVKMSGQGKILSANDSPYEASMLSTYYSPSADTFSLSGQVVVGGNIYTTNSDAGISVGRQVQVGDRYVVAGNVDFPEPDPSIYEPFATHEMSSHHPCRGTYTNIRIAANTNPTFACNTVLEGVTFIEAPNNVKFSGRVVIRGVIVTQDARDSESSSSLRFSGQVASYGVETLPDTPEFAGIKQLPGVFLMAPGFDAKFSGQFGTVNGAMAAQSFTMSGQAGGLIKGVVISYGDAPFKYSGQAGLIIDRSGSNSLPAGFTSTGRLTPLPDTYLEN